MHAPSHVASFKIWMAKDGYAPQTQKEYPYFLGRYCKAFRHVIDERTLASEDDVTRIAQDVERAIRKGGRGAGNLTFTTSRVIFGQPCAPTFDSSPTSLGLSQTTFQRMNCLSD